MDIAHPSCRWCLNIKNPPDLELTSNIKFSFLLSCSLPQEFKEVCKNLNKEQIEATFKKFDQTGNDKLSFREFRDMMGKRSESKGKTVKQQMGNNGKQSGNTGEQLGNNSGRPNASSNDKQATSSKAKTAKEGDQANP